MEISNDQSDGRNPSWRLRLMHIANISELAPRSDYRVDCTEGDNPFAGTKARACTVYVRDHDRNQSVWSLIAAALSVAREAEFYRSS
jgi:hypothetical protein